MPVLDKLRIKCGKISCGNQRLWQRIIKKKRLTPPGLVAASSQADYSFEKTITAIDRFIEGASTIDEHRKSFDQLSELMFALVKNNTFEGIKIYKQFCPMAFNNEGAYWLSKNENILNPYFGEKMLTCGYTQEITE